MTDDLTPADVDEALAQLEREGMVTRKTVIRDGIPEELFQLTDLGKANADADHAITAIIRRHRHQYTDEGLAEIIVKEFTRLGWTPPTTHRSHP